MRVATRVKVEILSLDILCRFEVSHSSEEDASLGVCCARGYHAG